MEDSEEKVKARDSQLDPIVMYLIVRESLGMGVGKIAAQCAHASQMITLEYFDLCRQIPTGKGWKTEQDSLYFEVMRVWLLTSFRKVVLKADESEWKKLKVLIDSDQYDWRSVTVVDSGLTEIAPGSETVIGLWPMYKSIVPKTVKRLQALK